jgi:peptide/nickel transport system permease protein
MIRFLFRRLCFIAITVVAASFMLFALMEFSPGNVASKTLGPYASDESKQILYDKLKLGDPLVVRYVRWVSVLVGAIEDPLSDPELNLGYKDPRGNKYFGNLGYSTLFNMPVADVIWQRLANTGMLAAIAFGILVPVSVLIGTLAGMNEGGSLDRILSFICIALTSIPEFALAVFCIAIFVVGLGWLPGASNLEAGRGWSIPSQMILPVLVLVLYDFGYVARIMRGSMAEVMMKPYIRTAQLKGLPQRTVILVHALKNAMIAPLTVIVLQINWLVSGVVVTEVVFAYPGFGRLLLEAAQFGDIALLEATMLFTLFLVAFTQIVGDVGYMLLNPRIRVG